MEKFRNNPMQYIEGYLDALKKVQDSHRRYPQMSMEDICLALRTSMKTVLTMSPIPRLPDDLTPYPSIQELLDSTKEIEKPEITSDMLRSIIIDLRKHTENGLPEYNTPAWKTLKEDLDQANELIYPKWHIQWSSPDNDWFIFSNQSY